MTPQARRARVPSARRSGTLLRVCHEASTVMPRPGAGPTDGELVTLALNGAERAFARLIDRHGEHLRRLLARRLRDPDDVLDIVQETHLAIWRALNTYDARRPFEAWLTTIALNKHRDWARHRRACAHLLERLERELAAPAWALSRAHSGGFPRRCAIRLCSPPSRGSLRRASRVASGSPARRSRCGSAARVGVSRRPSARAMRARREDTARGEDGSRTRTPRGNRGMRPRGRCRCAGSGRARRRAAARRRPPRAR